jgi:hypothetical protein
MRLSSAFARRHVVVAAVNSLLLLPPSSVLSPPSASAIVADGNGGAAARRLLESIPAMAYGAPATNATLPAELVQSIEAQTVTLERQFGGRNLIRDKNLNGSWRLLYSDGREITSLAAGFPGGFQLGPTYQPIDLATGRFENQGRVVNRFGLAQLNAAGVVNDFGNRIDVEFQRITFALDEVFGQPSTLRKVLVPNQAAGTAQPANDVTYLDASVRVVRGGDGALFIFRREESDRPMLSLAERETLFGDSAGVQVTTGTGEPEDSAPPELKRLLRGR